MVPKLHLLPAETLLLHNLKIDWCQPAMFRHQLYLAGCMFSGSNLCGLLHKARNVAPGFLQKMAQKRTGTIHTSCSSLQLCKLHKCQHEKASSVYQWKLEGSRTIHRKMTDLWTPNSRGLSTSCTPRTPARCLCSVMTKHGFPYHERTPAWRMFRVKHTKSGQGEVPLVFVNKAPSVVGKKNQKKQPTEPKSPVVRSRTKKPTRLGLQDKKDTQDSWLCTAFSTAEEYHLEHLSLDLQSQGSFLPVAMPQDAQDVLLMDVASSDAENKTEPSEMFFFREGSVVFWNVPDSTLKKVLRIVNKYESRPYEVALVTWENEHINYSYGSQGTKLTDDAIILDENADTETTMLEKFAFSNAMALSVKLGIWELSVDKFTSSLERIPESLKHGHRLKMSRLEVMRKTGELFSLRHQINLSSDLLISPDFYWDRDDLDELYNKTCHFYSIGRRTRVTNEKLNHCSELVELMRTHLSERHSLKLEWMIILLIAVEVMFEVVHYIRRYYEDSGQGIAEQTTSMRRR
ncbi:required for meiotic nuclear division protein 1 homolog [Patiria miniata]|uniref:DUF155 domain-containing protein n=1 Tax=Patiria miniata TaxID=46514 RepID=A0A914A8F6_PATMI|nr:required for meiotic nuclear division protein 1 homolog [Patiria miniata]